VWDAHSDSYHFAYMMIFPNLVCLSVMQRISLVLHIQTWFLCLHNNWDQCNSYTVHTIALIRRHPTSRLTCLQHATAKTMQTWQNFSSNIYRWMNVSM
jgi:hypothetical protein